MQQGVRKKYKVELNKDSERFLYSGCLVNPVELIRYPELIQGGKWSDTKISSDVLFSCYIKYA